ncbi:hypothetical protein [Dyadobacter sp. BHUBP1]|uniref:hypothetical protein n=1 Tax=Dyadobacter sp. BHUBP1 TaxID=3424178 RepID=UPI003D32A3BA
MKDIGFLLAAICLALRVYGQAPQVLHYQGIARNAQGVPLAGTTIAIRLSIKDAPDGGTTLYSERKSITTNAFGLYSVSINDGGGIRTGDFNTIHWQTGPKYLQTEIDPANGTTFVETGTMQMQSVPFALQAGRAANLNGVENPQEGDVMEYTGGSWKTKPKVQLYNVSGLGSNPTVNYQFMSPPVTITIQRDNPVVSIEILKAMGSTVAGGGVGLSVNVAYQKVGGTLTEFDENHRMNNLRVPSGTRVPIMSSGTYQTDFKAGETYQIGLIGKSSYPNSWNDSGFCQGRIEIRY